ncbi:MAG: hypothetical protein Q9228_002663 [Teloschistes exilis]
MGTLAVGDFKVRKAPYIPLLPENVSHVLPCHTYRGLQKNESHEAYVARLAQNLEDEFQRVGPETVCAFMVEPIVGTAAPAPATPGKPKAPHQTSKSSAKPSDPATRPSAPSSSTKKSSKPSAALEVQRIIKEDGLVSNVARMGDLLSSLLRERFAAHPYVGDIRGRGLFWCIEFVADRAAKAPFPAALNLAKRMANRGLERGYDISLFAANGSVDGWLGDHFLLCPPYIVGESDVEEIVKRVVKVVESVFEDVKREGLVKEMVDGLFERGKGRGVAEWYWAERWVDKWGWAG